MEAERSGIAARRRKSVFLDQVEDRHRPLMLDLRAAANHRAFVQRHLGDAPPITLVEIGQKDVSAASIAVA